MIKRIVAFGDSFTYGLIKIPLQRIIHTEERIQIKSYGEYIAESFNLEFDNKGICGAGNPTIANVIYNYEFKPGDFALISWSGINRPFKWNPKTKKVDCNTKTNLEESVYMGEVSVRFIQNFLEDYKIPFLMISAFQDYRTLKVGKFNNFNDNWIEPSKSNNTLFDIIALTWLDKDPAKYNELTNHTDFDVSNEFIAPCKHPSEKGHKLIAATLEPYIKKAINSVGY